MADALHRRSVPPRLPPNARFRNNGNGTNNHAGRQPSTAIPSSQKPTTRRPGWRRKEYPRDGHNNRHTNSYFLIGAGAVLFVLGVTLLLAAFLGSLDVSVSVTSLPISIFPPHQTPHLDETDPHHYASRSRNQNSPSRHNNSRQEDLSLHHNENIDQHDDDLLQQLSNLDDSIYKNLPTRYRADPKLLMPLDRGHLANPFLTQVPPKVMTPKFSSHGQFFRVSRRKSTTRFHRLGQRIQPMQWELEWEEYQKKHRSGDDFGMASPSIDYTREDLYEYITRPSSSVEDWDSYPPLRPFHDILTEWPLEEIDQPPTPKIHEVLVHFDFTNASQVAMAQQLQAKQVPFKYVNVPELLQANRKWTDEYVSQQFDDQKSSSSTTVKGKCQESPHAFFVFFQPQLWNVEQLALLPPTRNNDWTFATWSQHARYADAVGLSADRPHFYWQAGVPPEEREMKPSTWSFISHDLPSFSSPNATILCPQPLEQKGIQCRFGERGVTAATHFDAGQNYVGMITGAKRYILHPPDQCSKLGIVPYRESSIFRHSPLYFGKLPVRSLVDDKNNESSWEEEAWLKRAGSSMAVETVLKQGEVLFIPSYWFHSIIGLQKNAQCNVRSGVFSGSDESSSSSRWGGASDISETHCRA